MSIWNDFVVLSRGLRFKPGAPKRLDDGTVWYDGTDHFHKARQNGVTVSLGAPPATVATNATSNSKRLATRLAGTTGQRPTLTTTDAGQSYWDSTLGKAAFWDGAAWKLADGTSA